MKENGLKERREMKYKNELIGPGSVGFRTTGLEIYYTTDVK